MIKKISIKTSKKNELIDITPHVKNVVKESDVKSGICVVYSIHATGAIAINENADPMICEDILEMLGKIVPEGKWRHDRIDKNGAAHIKSAIIGPSKTIPINNNELMLGKWQDIFFCEFDGPRNPREVIVEIVKNY